MSTYAQVGVPAEVLVSGAPAGLVGQISVEVYDPTDGTSVIAPATTGITEPRAGTYRSMLTVPRGGSFMVRWTLPDARSTEEELLVGLSALTATTFRPTMAEVAAVTPSYTRGGFDDDEPQAGGPQGTYDESTSPTASQVEGLIDAALEEVAGRVGVAIPARLAGLAKRVVVWHVAASIAAAKVPAGVDETGSEYRLFISNYTACLADLTTLAREPNAMRLT